MIFAVAIVIACLSLGAKERTIEVTTNPVMVCENCVNKIKTNLRFVKGVKKISPSLKTKKVTVVYDDAKGSEADVIKGFEKIGFSATIVPDSVATQSR